MKKKEVLPAAEYYKLSDKARFRAFTVSRLADGDMVERVKVLLAQNLEDGSGLKGFLEKTDTEIMNGLGLGGNGGGWYWENVYRTNVQTAYNTGRALGFEAVKPVALELVGIGDMRQTDICRSLTQPPVRRLYSDPFWKTHWPPFHFGCRTTVRAIYDPGELEAKPVTAELPEEKPARGFGTYPVTNGNWWRELSSMSKRAKKYGIQKEIDIAKKILMEEGFRNREKLQMKAVQAIREKTPGYITNYENKSREEKREAVVDWLLRKGNASGKERYVLTDEKGTVLDIVKGKKNSVVFSERTINQIAKNKKPALILYHNHPGGNSFSQSDISVLLTNPEIKEMVAVGHNGVAVGHNGMVYSLRIGKGKRPVLKDFIKVYRDFFDKNNQQYGVTVKYVARKYKWVYTVHGGEK